MINIPHKLVSIVTIFFSLLLIGLIIFGVGFAGGSYTDWVVIGYISIPAFLIVTSIYNFFKASKILNISLLVIAVLLIGFFLL